MIAQNQLDFQHQVLAVTEASLREQGYTFLTNEDERILGGVEFRKLTDRDRAFLVSYRLAKYFEPPTRSFMIFLSRSEQSGQGGSTPIDLRNLLWGFYGVDIFLENKYEWEFRDDEELVTALENANSILIDYGLPWIEAAMLNLNWLHDPLKPRSDLRKLWLE